MIALPATGYIQVRAYASNAQIPLKDTAITVTDPEGTAIAMALTDRNGRIFPIPIPVPDRSESQSPSTDSEKPFTSVTLSASLDGYERIRVENLQIFADTVTIQDLVLIPLSELPSQWSKSETFNTPPQNL